MKAIGEVLEEVEEGSLYCRPDVLQRALDAVERNEPTTLSLVPKLLSSGLPLRGPHSVESILMSLTKHEAAVLQQCLWTPNGSSSHQAAVGLNPIQERLTAALRNLQSKEHPFEALFSGSNSGVLLYGPPGCGKTLLVRSLALSSKIPCLVLTPSVLLRKYIGETNHQVRSLFTLAQKLSPCVLCIDELDGLFRERNDHEHEVNREIKTEFLQWWDGLLSESSQILIIGATNRPFDVDNAVLRRLPQSFFIGLPDLTYRHHLLQHFLAHVPHEVDWHAAAAQTEGYSPSDLRQLLQTASLRPMQDQRQVLTTDDILQALPSCPPTRLSQNYVSALTQFSGRTSAPTRMERWETEHGNFYHLGTLHVDPPTFDVLQDLAKRLEDMSDDEDEE
jgi:SpoVK/Ycf46/Vps4 family AAA+-type ATPase